MLFRKKAPIKIRLSIDLYQKIFDKHFCKSSQWKKWRKIVLAIFLYVVQNGLKIILNINVWKDWSQGRSVNSYQEIYRFNVTVILLSFTWCTNTPTFLVTDLGCFLGCWQLPLSSFLGSRLDKYSQNPLPSFWNQNFWYV